MNSPAYCAGKADLVRLVEAATDELIESCGRPGTCIISTGSFARVAPFHETSAHAVREVISINLRRCCHFSPVGQTPKHVARNRGSVR